MFLVMYSGFSAVVIKSIMCLFKRGEKILLYCERGKEWKKYKAEKVTVYIYTV